MIVSLAQDQARGSSVRRNITELLMSGSNGLHLNAYLIASISNYGRLTNFLFLLDIRRSYLKLYLRLHRSLQSTPALDHHSTTPALNRVESLLKQKRASPDAKPDRKRFGHSPYVEEDYDLLVGEVKLNDTVFCRMWNLSYAEQDELAVCCLHLMRSTKHGLPAAEEIKGYKGQGIWCKRGKVPKLWMLPSTNNIVPRKLWVLHVAEPLKAKFACLEYSGTEHEIEQVLSTAEEWDDNPDEAPPMPWCMPYQALSDRYLYHFIKHQQERI
ncbi:hypothetical protein LTR95_008671 [Oleoguttula sp. CCFEE 5521]